MPFTADLSEVIPVRSFPSRVRAEVNDLKIRSLCDRALTIACVSPRTSQNTPIVAGRSGFLRIFELAARRLSRNPSTQWISTMLLDLMVFIRGIFWIP